MFDGINTYIEAALLPEAISNFSLKCDVGSNAYEPNSTDLPAANEGDIPKLAPNNASVAANPAPAAAPLSTSRRDKLIPKLLSVI